MAFELRKGTKVFVSEYAIKAIALGQIWNPGSLRRELVVKITASKNHKYFRPGEVTSVHPNSVYPRECRYAPRGRFKYAYFPHRIIWSDLPIYHWSTKPNKYNENYPVLEKDDDDTQAQKAVEKAGQDSGE